MIRALLIALPVCMTVLSCSTGPSSIAGTETGNGAGGRAAFSDGSPAIGAHVMMVPSFYEELNPPNRDFMIVSTVTDSAGRYRFKNLIEGYYSIFCEKDGYKSFVDSVCITDTFTEVTTSVVTMPGTCRGVSYYSSGNIPVNACLVITGSRYYSHIDESTGSFYLADLPAGVYKAKIAGSTVDYFQNSFNIAISESGTDSIAEPVVLVSNSVTSLLQADDGSLWVGTTNGLVRIIDNRWIAYGLHDGLTSSRITCLAQNADTCIWVGTTFRLAQFISGRLTKNYDFIDAITTVNVKVLRSNSRGEVWVGTGRGLYLNDDGKWTEITFTDTSIDRAVGSAAGNELSDISAIALQGRNVLVGTRHGLFIRDSAEIWNAVEALKNVSINALEVVDAATFLAGTNNGLFKCGNNGIEKITISESGMANAVTCILSFAGKWFAGTENGLYICDQGAWSAADLGPLDNYVTAIATGNNNIIWIGTTNGLCRYSENSIEIIR